MSSIPELAIRILREIAGGEMIYQTISSESAEMIGIPDAEAMTQAEATEVEQTLDELEQRGLIEIENRSASGFFAVRRMTWQGRDFLASLKS